MPSLPNLAIALVLCASVAPARLAATAEPRPAEDAACRASAEGCDLASLLQLAGPLGSPAAAQPRLPRMRADDPYDADEDVAGDAGAGGPLPEKEDLDADGDEADGEDVGGVERPPGGSEPTHSQPKNPLQELVGTWESTGLGLNVVALPQHKGGRKITADFLLWVQNMTERLTFRRMAPVTNRGYWHADHRHPPRQENQHLKGVRYEQTVWKAGKEEGRRGRVIHEESGMWFYNAVPGVDKGWTVERQAVIGTGAVFMMLGQNRTIHGLAALEEDLRSELLQYQTLPALGGPPDDEDYLNPYFRRNDTAVLRPVERLLATLAEVAERPNHTHVETVKLHVSTDSSLKGFLDTRPGVRVQAPNRDFEASFWLQTWTDGAGRVVRRQLQYAQGVHMFFRVQFNKKCELLPHRGCLIDWPHVQVDTLVKVPDHAPEDGHKPGGEDGHGPGEPGGEPDGRKPGGEDGPEDSGEPGGHKPGGEDGNGPGEPSGRKPGGEDDNGPADGGEPGEPGDDKLDGEDDSEPADDGEPGGR